MKCQRARECSDHLDRLGIQLKSEPSEDNALITHGALTHQMPNI